MLKEEFLASYGLSQNALAKAIGISPNRIADREQPPPHYRGHGAATGLVFRQ
jgi:hypothetical protein